jgi:predicted nucleotidyltransferase component of viral defense system
MIDKDELLKTSVYEHPFQKEKDYIQEMFLMEIFNAVGGLVFKGGAALSKFYGSVRFSDDLDFSVIQANQPARLDEVVKKLSRDYPLKVMRRKNNTKMLSYELSIRGPLFEVVNKYQHLKIEVDKNASVISQTNIFHRNPVYADLRPYVAVVMSEKEILAEKVVALLFRHNIKARDLYDLHFLVQKGVKIEVAMIDKKMKEHYHVFTKDRFLSRVKSLKNVWNKQLTRLLPEKNFITYNEAEKLVTEHFQNAGLL